MRVIVTNRDKPREHVGCQRSLSFLQRKNLLLDCIFAYKSNTNTRNTDKSVRAAYIIAANANKLFS